MSAPPLSLHVSSAPRSLAPPPPCRARNVVGVAMCLVPCAIHPGGVLAHPPMENGRSCPLFLSFRENLKQFAVPTSITNHHKSMKSRFFCHRRIEVWRGRPGSAQRPSLEQTDALSAATAVAGESDQLNSPQFASNPRLFRRLACSTDSLQPPVKPSAQSSHEHSGWMYLRRCGLVRTGNRSGTAVLRCEGSSVRAVFWRWPGICRRPAPKTIITDPLACLYICTFVYSRYFAHAMVC